MAGSRSEELELLDRQSRSKLAALAGQSPPTVTLLVAAQHDVGLAVASTLARYWVPDQIAREHDLVIAVPEGKWNVEQLRSQVLAPLQYLALVRRLVVIDRVEELDAVSTDHLLKAIEEPIDPNTAFILLTSDENVLPATLRGRAAARVVLSSASVQDRVAYLLRAGVAPAVAEEAVSAAGSLTMTTSLFAYDEKLRAEAVSLVAAVETAFTTPGKAATQTVEHVEKLAKGLSHLFSGTASSSDRGERAARRALAEAQLERIRTVVIDLLRDGAALPTVEQGLQALDGSTEQLRNHAPLALVFTVAYLAIRDVARSAPGI